MGKRGPLPSSDRVRALEMRLLGRTYADIGVALGVSRQRAQQLLSPPGDVRRAVLARAHGACQRCGIALEISRAHVHHTKATGLDPDDYNDLPNLVALCTSCHGGAHFSGGPR